MSDSVYTHKCTQALLPFIYHNELRSMHCKKCVILPVSCLSSKECRTVTIVIIAMSSSAQNHASLLQQSLTVTIVIIAMPSSALNYASLLQQSLAVTIVITKNELASLAHSVYTCFKHQLMLPSIIVLFSSTLDYVACCWILSCIIIIPF